jgi:hypothetical protein
MPLKLSKASAAPIEFKCAKIAHVQIEDGDVYEILFDNLLGSVGILHASLDQLKTEIINGEQLHDHNLTLVRNKLISTTLSFSIVSANSAVVNFIGAYFGMNLVDGYETTPGIWRIAVITAFMYVFFGSLTMSAALSRDVF